MVQINQVVRRAYIVAYREDTAPLERALTEEGFQVFTLRPNYSPVEQTYSQTIRVLINHASAWRACEASGEPALVVEADFVPVKGMGKLPLPFQVTKLNHAWGWLYACGAALWHLDEQAFACGHSAAPVATVMSPETARVLLQFYQHELATIDPLQYSLWDTSIGHFAKANGIHSWLPYRQYGEHGGIPNPEHLQATMICSVTHRADVLYGPLHFLPAYARGSRFRYLYTRIKGKLWGLGRLLTGRYVALTDLRHSIRVHRMSATLRFVVFRWLTFR